jgi:hypothetical protein
VKKRKILTAILLGINAFASGFAHASLVDRGGGLIYDTVLNITWLQDANYGAGTVYDLSGEFNPIYRSWDTDGRMSWANAISWADTLVFHDIVRNINYNDWRLPISVGVGGLCAQYNCKNSEMGHLFFVDLGNKAIYDEHGNYQPDYGLTNTGPFVNLQPSEYWSSTLQNSSEAYSFYMSAGYQVANGTNYWGIGSYAMAVRDGDVSMVPEPESIALVLLGLGLMTLFLQRRFDLRLTQGVVAP